MAFNFKDFARFTWIALFRSKGTHYRLTPKRIAWALALYGFFPLLELVNGFCFLLDDIFFPGYRVQEIRRPVFIVGNPRSGTTFLQRLMAKDRENFTCMHLWEILFAPSITQRKILRSLWALDRRLGGMVHRWLSALEKKWEEQNAMHKIAMRAPEEDQYLLVHIWSTVAVWVYAAILEETTPYVRFDTAMPPAVKNRVMSFYRRCVQRHLYDRSGNHGANHYLSKNPSASPKIGSLYECFPDSKIIYLVRNPLDVIPSYISMLDHTWNVLCDPLEPHGSRDYVLQMSRHWYTYPLERLERAPQDSHIIVNYDDLVDDPEEIVAEIYDRFGFEIGPDFDQVLEEEGAKARSYRSKHKYSLRQMGLTREQIVSEYEDVFDRFGFDTREDPAHTGTGPGSRKERRRRCAARRRKPAARRNLGFARKNLERGEA